MRGHKVVSQTYDAEQDTFRVFFLIGPCMLLARDQLRVLCDRGALDFFNDIRSAHSSSASPIAATKNADTLTGNYVFLLGGYRAFVPLELDLPLFYRTWVQPVDRMGVRAIDSCLLRFFLLLSEIFGTTTSVCRFLLEE